MTEKPTIKKADLEYIDNETKEFMGLDFHFDGGHLGGMAIKESCSVELIYSPEWDKWINAMVQTAFTTWDNGIEISINHIPKEKREQIVLDYLKKRPISAVLESACFVFHIKNIPRTMTHQIVRYRGMSFNQESFRVSPAHHSDVRIPQSLSTEDQADLSILFGKLRETYVKLVKERHPIEQVRNILPMGTCTNITMTTNLKALQGYIKARTLDITQDEHTYIVMLIAKQLKEKAPQFYDNFIKNDKLEKFIEQYEVD